MNKIERLEQLAILLPNKLTLETIQDILTRFSEEENMDFNQASAMFAYDFNKAKKQ